MWAELQSEVADFDDGGKDQDPRKTAAGAGQGRKEVLPYSYGESVAMPVFWV